MNIAVTGGMGSGKSMVCKALAELLGAMTVSADTICRDLLAPRRPGWQEMQQRFSTDFFLEDGQVNRPFLRKAIFSDPAVREQLDALLHPLVRKELFAFFALAEKKGVDLVAEVPLLFEKGWQGDFDCTVVVSAANDICVQRIMQRDLVSKSDAQESISSQMPLADKVLLGDVVIENSESFAATLEGVEQLYAKLSGEGHFKGKNEDG